MRRVLVTGGGGYIGSVLCGMLERLGVQVVVLQRHKHPHYETLQVDLAGGELDPTLLSGVDTVFHLAGKAHAKTNTLAEHMAINCGGTARLLGACCAAGVPNFIFFSSIKAMGEETHGLEDEASPVKPESAYGCSKLAAEKLVLDSCIPHKVVLRPALVFGLQEKGNMGRMGNAIRRGWFPALPNGDNARTLVHVEDLACAAIFCATSREANGEVFIVTDGKFYSTKDIYRILCERVGAKPAKWSIPLCLLRGMARLGDYLGDRCPWNGLQYRALFGSAQYSSLKLQKLGWSPKKPFDAVESYERCVKTA